MSTNSELLMAQASKIVLRAQLEGRITSAQAEAFAQAERQRIHKAALEAMKADPRLDYYSAVVAVSRTK
jgi:hypothetical protein